MFVCEKRDWFVVVVVIAAAVAAALHWQSAKSLCAETDRIYACCIGTSVRDKMV